MLKKNLKLAPFLLTALFIASCASTGMFVDSRDGKTYKTVQIGGQTWMAENVNYKTKEGSHCFDCKKYGRLYEWNAAQEACPEGWRLPTKKEWKDFYSRLEHPEMLKASSDWTNHNSNDIDYYAFSVLPAGRYDDGNLKDRGNYAQFWSADVNEGPYFLPGNNTNWSEISGGDAAVSVRCVQGVGDEYKRSESVINLAKNVRNIENGGVFIDPRDGQKYRTIKIGNQEWFAENLNYNAIASFCYDNEQENCEKYGRIYDWIAAEHSCPDGWHLPDDSEWKSIAMTMTNDTIPEVRYEDDIEILLYEPRYKDFHHPLYDTLNFRLFSRAAPRGYKNYEYPHFWSATQRGLSLHFNLWSFGRSVNNRNAADFTELFPVRCVNGSTSISENSSFEKLYQLRVQKNDTTLKIKDNRDGQFYKYVTIGSQTWLAENMNYKTKNSVCYDNEVSNCEKYGMLYDYDDARNVCPAGWRLPDAVDWAVLKNESSSGEIVEYDVRNLLAQKDDWKDFYGFSALRAGYLDEDYKTFDDLGKTAVFWAYNKNYPEETEIQSTFFIGDWHRWGKLSVRCIKKEKNIKYSGSFKDSRDGQKYKTVRIGNHIWMAENLNYESPNEESRCYNDKQSLCAKYGRLYTQDAAKTACPIGWHLPRENEYVILSDAAKIHNAFNTSKPFQATKGWGNKKSQNGTDDFGFSALPGGGFYKTDFTLHKWLAGKVGEKANFWTTDGYLEINSGNTIAWTGSTRQIFGGEGMFSIRCVQDY